MLTKDFTVSQIATANQAYQIAHTRTGRSLYVAKEVVDFEVPLYETQPQWMSAKQAQLFEQGRQRLASGMGMPVKHYLAGAE